MISMRIEEFLSLLEPRRKHKDAKGWKCKCPAHDDSTESLHVSTGQDKHGREIILVKCFAGCGFDEIVKAMGLQSKDLICEGVDDKPPWDVGKVRKAVPTYEKRQKAALSGASRQLPQGGSQEQDGQKKAKAQDHGPKTIEKTYPYTDEDGTLLYEAVRYRYQDGTKTFRQRRPDPEKPGQWLWELSGVRLVLYRLPAVAAAIRAGEPVWIAEGEKDADNLAALGLCGTSSPMGAGKWNKGTYSESLRGASCYILPDNDEPGWQHARDVAQALENVAANCRILDLRRVWPDIPPKNDVSDLIAHLGAEKAKEALLRMAQDKSVQYDDLPGIYQRVPGYGMVNGRISQYVEGGSKPLCNFTALPICVLTLDDGIAAVKQMEIRGWTAAGKELPRALVPVTQFPGMTWISEKWDIAANMAPGNTVKDKLRYAIAEAGRMVVERKTQYTHTGWRKIGDKWAYLHGGGAIGADRINTALEGGLARYRLEGGGHSFEEGFRASRNLLTVMSEHVAVPLLSLVYLAPLRHFLALSGIPPNFALFLVGKGGGRKSTAAALALCHFGQFTSQTPTASFHDTANSVRKKAFCLKDMPLLIDDYHPTQSQQEKRKMEAMAQDLARAFGDNADRGRMNADRSLQTAQPPRCVAVMTGEDMPLIGESGLARFFIVRMGAEDVPITEALTQAQQQAADGILQDAMIGYIRYLRGMADDLKNTLKAKWMELRQEARRRFPQGSHARGAEAAAFLMLGWLIMLMYGYTLGEITRDSLAAEAERGWKSLMDSGKSQAAEAREDTPANAFLDCLKEMLSSKQAWVKELTLDPEKRNSGGGPGMIGYLDDQYYMLLPDLAYRMVAEVYTRQGTQFPLSKRGTLRALAEAGYVTCDSGCLTKTKWIDGRTVRLLWIRRHHIDGGPPPAAQTGFLEVTDDPDNPF